MNLGISIWMRSIVAMANYIQGMLDSLMNGDNQSNCRSGSICWSSYAR